MKFKIDHNLPTELAELLRAANHEASTAFEQGLADADDPILAAHCAEEGRCLVTLDLGFGNIHAYPPDQYPGLIVLRARHQDKPTLLALGRAFIPLLQSEPIAGKLWIVEADRIRIHA